MWRSIRDWGGNFCCRLGLGSLICILLILLAAKSNRFTDTSFGLNYESQALASNLAPVQVLQTSEQTQLAKLQTLASEDPVSLLRLALKNYQKSVRDYVCVFTKQERISGHLRDQEVIKVCCKEAPFSVLMTWPNPKGQVDKILFVEKNGNTTLLARPTGFFGMLVNTIRRDVNDPSVKKASLRGPHQLGFAKNLQSMVEVCEQAAKNGDLKFEFLGHDFIDNRPCLVLLRTLPMEKGYPAAKLKIYLDQEYLLPTSMENYDTAGNLLSKYTYTNIRFNLGLTDQVFSPRANGMTD